MLACFYLILACGVLGEKNLVSAVKLGRNKEEFGSVEEVKGHDIETTSEHRAEDAKLIEEAILDVAYYLRRFKFKGYDPRYLEKDQTPNPTIYVEFPSPPLRSIHWEVKKNCEPSFVECVKFLQEKVSRTVLPRHLDSLTITREKGWSLAKDEDFINSTNADCIELLEKDEKTFSIFSGPLEKFQWLTSASYYMCLYTMKEVESLKFFKEDCDNYASCLPSNYSASNNEYRASNKKPFACATYSFCPDPCCSRMYMPRPAPCSEGNPCAVQSLPDETCTYSRKENANLESLILNQWNVSCLCDQTGMRWDSKSGMCVDIDECTELDSVCNFPMETCRNLPGSYECVCSMMGYRSNPKTKVCEHDPIMQHVLYPPYSTQQNETKSFSDKFYDIINKFKSVMAVSLVSNEAEPNKTETS